MGNQDIETKFLDTPLTVDGDLDEPRKGLRDEFLVEAKKQVLLAGPLLSVNFFTSLIQVISVMFVGHVGSDLALSGASMATSLATVTGFALLVGSANALDTFCGQSYGAKQYHMLGILMQRGMFVLVSISIPIACILANAGKILLLLGQDPQISAESGNYACFLIPGIFAFAILQCQIRFLGCQNNVVPMMIVTGFTILLHIAICWALAFKSGLGSKGAALAVGVSYWINVVLLALYIRFSPSCNTKTWTGFSTKALHDIPTFVGLAVPSGLMMCLETWSIEVMVLMAGLLPNPTLETSVLSICFNTIILFSNIPLGLGAAVRVSNELGAGRSREAYVAVCVGVSIVAIECISLATIIVLGRKLWANCFSTEEMVVKYLVDMMLFMAASHICDGLQGFCNGVVRGCGWQKIGVFVDLGSYYLIGVPSGILLAFVSHLGGKGLWTGIIISELVQVLSFFLIIVHTNWRKEGAKALARIQDAIHVQG